MASMSPPTGRSVRSMCQSMNSPSTLLSRALMPYNFLAQSTRARAPGLHSEFPKRQYTHLGQIPANETIFHISNGSHLQQLSDNGIVGENF